MWFVFSDTAAPSWLVLHEWSPRGPRPHIRNIASRQADSEVGVGSSDVPVKAEAKAEVKAEAKAEVKEKAEV